MPITKSAKKALRQNIRRRKRNLTKKKAYKEAIKSYRRLLTENKAEEAKVALSRVYKTLDKAAKTNVIAKNKAARLKSKLSKLLYNTKSKRASS